MLFLELLKNNEIDTNILSRTKKPLEYLKSSLKCIFETVGNSSKRTFKVAVKVNGIVYNEVGNTKTHARCKVVEKVFQKIKTSINKQNTKEDQIQNKKGKMQFTKKSNLIVFFRT